jgi:hypothetical protein
MGQSTEWFDVTPRLPIERSDEEVRLFLQDLVVKQIDPAVRKFFDAPLYLGLIAFPSHAHELVTWAANADPSERKKMAMAMVELLMRWGYLQ